MAARHFRSRQNQHITAAAQHVKAHVGRVRRTVACNSGRDHYCSILEVHVNFAIEILERDRLRIREVLRSIERYEHEIQHGLERGSLNDQEAELQKAIAHLQSAEQGESPATDRQQRQYEISALRDLVQLIDDSVMWSDVNLSEIGADKLNRAKDVLKLLPC